MKVCGVWACVLVGLQASVASAAFADSLRLPDAQQEKILRFVPAEQGATFVPAPLEKQDIIISSPEITVQPKSEVDTKPEEELVEQPRPHDTPPVVIDDAASADPPHIPSNINVPTVENKNAEIKERIVEVPKMPSVPAETLRPVLTIEDILADPMKNGNPKSSKSDSQSLPQDTQKMDFLEGKWRCETDLINLENDSPIVFEFTFDKNGNGDARLKEKTGRIFSGSANAVLKNGILDIKVEKLATPNSSATYNGSNIQCRQKGATAICSGKNTGKPSVAWHNASFHRVK